MGKIPVSIHGCAAKDAKEAEGDRQSDIITRGERGVDGRFG